MLKSLAICSPNPPPSPKLAGWGNSTMVMNLFCRVSTPTELNHYCSSPYFLSLFLSVVLWCPTHAVLLENFQKTQTKIPFSMCVNKFMGRGPFGWTLLNPVLRFRSSGNIPPRGWVTWTCAVGIGRQGLHLVIGRGQGTASGKAAIPPLPSEWVDGWRKDRVRWATSLVGVQCSDCWLGNRKGILPATLVQSYPQFLFRNEWRTETETELTRSRENGHCWNGRGAGLSVFTLIYFDCYVLFSGARRGVSGWYLLTYWRGGQNTRTYRAHNCMATCTAERRAYWLANHHETTKRN